MTSMVYDKTEPVCEDESEVVGDVETTCRWKDCDRHFDTLDDLVRVSNYNAFDIRQLEVSV